MKQIMLRIAKRFGKEIYFALKSSIWSLLRKDTPLTFSMATAVPCSLLYKVLYEDQQKLKAGCLGQNWICLGLMH